MNSGNGIFQKLVTILGPNLISMFIAFGTVILGNHEPYYPWTDSAVKTAGICNGSPCTGGKGWKNYPQTSASELYRTDRYYYLPCRFRLQSSWSHSFLS